MPIFLEKVYLFGSLSRLRERVGERVLAMTKMGQSKAQP
jgi:hypothetical protein